MFVKFFGFYVWGYYFINVVIVFLFEVNGYLFYKVKNVYCRYKNIICYIY